LILGHNCFAWLFVYTGFVGSLLFIKAFRDYLRRMKVSHVIPLVFLLFALANMAGGFETARFWGYAFLFIGVFKKASETHYPTADSVSNKVDRPMQLDRAV
jgi:hypothetical protein